MTPIPAAYNVPNINKATLLSGAKVINRHILVSSYIAIALRLCDIRLDAALDVKFRSAPRANSSKSDNATTSDIHTLSFAPAVAS